MSLQWRHGSVVACCRVRGTECSSACTGPFEGGSLYLHYLHHSWASGQTTGREHSPIHQYKIGLKIYWAWPSPSEQDPVSSLVSLSHQEVSISLLSVSIRGHTWWKPQSQKTNKLITWTTVLSNSMKLWIMPCRATQDGWVTVESSDKTWSTGEGNGNPLQYSCFENPMNSMKRQKDRTLKDELPRSVGIQYVTGDRWRNNSRKNEEMEPKQKQHPVVDVTGDGLHRNLEC